MLPNFVNDQLSLDLTADSRQAESGERRAAITAPAMPVRLERLLTAREVGQRLGLSTATVLRLLASWRVGPAPAAQPSA